MNYFGLSANIHCPHCKLLRKRTRFVLVSDERGKVKKLMDDFLSELTEHKKRIPKEWIINNTEVHFIYDHLDLLVGRLLYFK